MSPFSRKKVYGREILPKYFENTIKSRFFASFCHLKHSTALKTARRANLLMWRQKKKVLDSMSKSAARCCPLFGTQEVKAILSHTGGPVFSMIMDSSWGTNG